MLLTGKPVIDHLRTETQACIETYWLKWSYVQFLLLSDDEPSRVYVKRKSTYAASLGLESMVLHQPQRSLEEVLQTIAVANADDRCCGIVVQLPLAKHLQPYQATIVTAVSPQKDLDGLWWVLFGLSATGHVKFIPATPKAVLEMLRFYELDDVAWKTVVILWQSNLTGKPLAVELMNRGATVCSCNVETPVAFVKEVCRACDILVSATWVVHLVDKEYLGFEDSILKNKVLIDVGRWIRNGKAVGDIDREYFQDRVKAITPVPWGVGPVTVACLFHNLIPLQQAKAAGSLPSVF